MDITVVIPTYQPVKEWFQKCLDSCKGVDEILIGNNGNKDFDISDYRLPEGTEVKVIDNDINLGCFPMANILISLARGIWISGQADDDYYDYENFPEILKTVRKSEADVVYFPCQYFGKYNYIYGYSPDLIFSDIYNANNIYGTSFFRKSMWEFLGGFQLDIAADWDFWLRALKSGFKFEFYPKIGGHFRVTERSMFENMLQKLGRDEINRIVYKNVDKWNKVYIREKIEIT